MKDITFKEGIKAAELLSETVTVLTINIEKLIKENESLRNQKKQLVTENEVLKDAIEAYTKRNSIGGML